MSKPKPQGVLWVCVDCLFAREGDGLGDGCSCGNTPWQREPDTDVSLGLGVEDHDCGWDGEADMPCDGDCERDEFSIWPCHACDCHLAGSRHAYTWWA